MEQYAGDLLHIYEPTMPVVVGSEENPLPYFPYGTSWVQLCNKSVVFSIQPLNTTSIIPCENCVNLRLEQNAK